VILYGSEVTDSRKSLLVSGDAGVEITWYMVQFIDF